MNAVIDFFEGKKTYTVAALVALVTFAQMVGWIDTKTAIELFGLLGAGGLATLRSAVANSTAADK